MILYVIVAAVTIALACMVRTNPYDSHRMSRQRVCGTICVAAVFTILTILAALRLEVGNDYGTYVTTCHEIFQHGYVVTEPGYNLAVRILYTLSGKEDYLLMFGVFGAAIVAVFLKCIYDQSDSFALGFFLFMTLGIYFRSFNTVRYYFALGLTLFSLRYVVKLGWQNVLKFLALILVAATFHKSVLVVIPMYALCRLPWKKWMIVLLGVFGVCAFLLRDKIMELALILYPSYKGTEYIEGNGGIMDNAPMILRCVLVLILCVVCYKEAIACREDNKLYARMSILAIVMYISCSFLPLISRFGYYLVTAQILLVPNIICSITDERKRGRVKTVVIIVAVLYFGYFLMTADAPGVRVLPYKSWLFDSQTWLFQNDLMDYGAITPIVR